MFPFVKPSPEQNNLERQFCGKNHTDFRLCSIFLILTLCLPAEGELGSGCLSSNTYLPAVPPSNERKPFILKEVKHERAVCTMQKLLELCGIKKKYEDNAAQRPPTKNPCCADISKHHKYPEGGLPLQITNLRRGSCDPHTGAPKPGCFTKDGHKYCHKYAFVTLATNDTYGLGCLVLGESLRKVETQHEIIAMVTGQVTDSLKCALRKVFDHVVQYDILDSKDEANLSLLQRPELGVTLTKLHCWTLIAYQKAVFLDADALVVRNCDELFEQYEEFSAAPDIGWPDCFNSGVFVYAPSLSFYQKLLEFTRTNRSFDGGDQGILNMFFNNWPRGDIETHLPFIYNMVASILYSYRPAFRFFSQNVKIVHFLGATKPWQVQYDVRKHSIQRIEGLPTDTADLVKFWWKIFVERVIPNTSQDLAGDAAFIVARTKRMLSGEEPSIDEAGQVEENMDVYADVRSVILADVS